MIRIPPAVWVLAAALALSVPPVPPVAAEEYVVRGGARVASGETALLERAVAPFRSLGLVSRRALRNLPGTLVVEMPPATAGVLTAQGFDVAEIPIRRVASEGSPAPWPLDRVNQRAPGLDGNGDRYFTGEGVQIFLLDTGIFPDFLELGGRFLGGVDYLRDGLGIYATCGQDHTHATIVASAAAGNVYGVAPGATVTLARIADCGGFISGAGELAALDDVVSWRLGHLFTPAVVNMSYSGIGAVAAEEELFQKLAALGVVLVDAAGNAGQDACQYSPARSPETITVGISDIDDQRPPRSNFGRCVDLFAPGKDVPVQGGFGPLTVSGSSLSAPYAAGAAALLLEQVPGLSPSAVKLALVANATHGVMTGDLGLGSPNVLLYDGPILEEVVRLIPRWFPEERRFTVQIAVALNEAPTPFRNVRLFRGLLHDGHCQGQPFTAVELTSGAAVASIVGWQQAPSFLCIETETGAVYERYVRTLEG